MRVSTKSESECLTPPAGLKLYKRFCAWGAKGPPGSYRGFFVTALLLLRAQGSHALPTELASAGRVDIAYYTFEPI